MAKKSKQADSLLKLKSDSFVYRNKKSNRQIKSGLRGETAARVIGDVEPGFEMFGFTKGQFCCINILEHVLSQVGPADVVICTWSAASGDIKSAHRMLSLNKIKSLKFIIDFSFKSRKPKFCEELIESFGADAIRVTSIHAKFMTVKTEKYNIVIRTSMNLNFNPRFENFEISDDKNLYDFVAGIVGDIWETQEAHEGFISPSHGKNSFKKMYPEQTGINISDMQPADISDMVLV